MIPHDRRPLRAGDHGSTDVTSADVVFENWVKAGYPVAKPAK